MDNFAPRAPAAPPKQRTSARLAGHLVGPYNSRMPSRDYYEILGVPRTATADQIKAAYRKLARKHHPDVNKAKDAAEKFKEATAAYEVLSDPAKRQQYDQFGAEGPPGAGFGGQRPGRGGGRTHAWSGGQGVPFDFEEVFSGSNFSGMSLEELMAALGGGGRRGRRAGAHAPVGGDLEYEVTLDFLQAAKGTVMPLRLTQPDGRAEQLDVRIPPGMHDGSKVRVRGKGHPGPGGAGDLYIIIRVREHPVFRREGQDIHTDLPVTVTEAALGGTATIPTLDGPTELTIPAGASSGMKLRLRGKGVSDPKTGQRGDHYVVLKIVLPRTISEKGKQLLKQFAQSDPYDPRKDMPI